MIKTGIKKAQIVARFEKINVGNKTVILDVAHNPAAVQTLVNTLSDSLMETVAIFSALSDKNIDDIIELASSNIKHWFLVPLSAERSIKMETLEDKFDDSQETTVCVSMASAIEQALALKGIQRIVIFGSFYTVADASVILKEI
jgi:dihydrofolate synthase/folylpolyglutamate synthase